MSTYKDVVADGALKTAVEALKNNGFNVDVVEDLHEAKSTVLSKVKEGDKVFTGTSVTLNESGLDEALNAAPYESVRNKFMQYYGQPENALKMKQIGGAADVSVASVHAITQDGKLLVASRTGSQIPAASYGANKVIFVAGTHKIVKDLADGIKRIEQHSVPLEDVRAKAAYGVGTKFQKLLVLNGEDNPDRAHVVLVKQAVGY